MIKNVELQLTNDYIFKRLFSKKGNEDILKDLLEGILEIPIEKVEVMQEVELERVDIKDKLGILDIRAIINENITVDIEMQMVDEKNMIERTLFYWAGLYYTGLKRGQDYKLNNKVITINILMYNIFKKENYHTIATIRDNENNEKIKAINEREKAEEQLQTEIETTYSFVKKIISGSFCRQLEYIDNIGINRWLDIDEFYHELGKKQGYNEDIINNSVFEFIEIYAYFGRYRASYRYMVSMAKENDTWVYINESTFKWACEQNLGWQVIDAMENSLKNNKIRYEHIKDYEEKISKLKKIRGF